jgi:hypothetical protein
MPRPGDCLRVEKVAQGSVAAQAGVFPGDWLAEVNGAKAASIDPELAHHWTRERRYRFFNKETSEQTLLVTSGIPPGLELSPTAASVVASFDPERPDTDALYSLWKQGEWSGLQRLASSALDARAPSGLIARLAGKANRNTPCLVLLGAALYERGRNDDARALFQEYMRDYASNWTQNFMGVAEYYLARDSLESGANDEALDVACSAHLNCESERTADLVEEISGRRPPIEPRFWMGERFPIDYALPVIEARGGPVSLSARLKAMGTKKLLIVCLLASYRGNGPYNAFMKRFRNYATYFPNNLSELHVVTMVSERHKDRDHWFEAEDLCRGDRLPFVVLHESGEVTEALDPKGSPSILVLDRSGVVIQEGSLNDVDFWQALGGSP